jgi:acyl-CoA reductase-like NAD-dependent aldehyde dehydrogenase
LLTELLHAAFSPDELRVFSGDATMGRAFAALPFDHLVFTGSTAVGRSVMQSAAGNLTPVTLELGGKSPTLLAPDYPLAKAVPRIIYGKAFNAGQTRIAPDYVLLPAGKEPEFEQLARAAFGKLYPQFAQTLDYTSIIDERHQTRLQSALEEAQAGGARVVPLAADAGVVARRMPVTLVFNPPPDCVLMREEVFGPALAVISYAEHAHAVDFVLARPRPLAAYLFDDDRGRVEQSLQRIVAGGCGRQRRALARRAGDPSVRRRRRQRHGRLSRALRIRNALEDHGRLSCGRLQLRRFDPAATGRLDEPHVGLPAPLHLMRRRALFARRRY